MWYAYVIPYKLLHIKRRNINIQRMNWFLENLAYEIPAIHLKSLIFALPKQMICL